MRHSCLDRDKVPKRSKKWQRQDHKIVELVERKVVEEGRRRFDRLQVDVPLAYPTEHCKLTLTSAQLAVKALVEAKVRGLVVSNLVLIQVTEVVLSVAVRSFGAVDDFTTRRVFTNASSGPREVGKRRGKVGKAAFGLDADYGAARRRLCSGIKDAVEACGDDLSTHRHDRYVRRVCTRRSRAISARERTRLLLRLTLIITDNDHLMVNSVTKSAKVG